MSQDTRIFNITRGFHLKRNQAIKAITACACAWVEYGETIRDLSIAESIAARNKQAADRDPLPGCELPGLLFVVPAAGQAKAREERSIARDADRFFCEARS